jgi:hypothetical protein
MASPYDKMWCEVWIMTLKEAIVSKIQNLSQSGLAEVYEIVEKIEEREREPSLMERLSKIRIQGPPDFAENFELYTSGEKTWDGHSDSVEKDGDVR